ncbi:TPM domain-containing protein [Bacillus horti]|uniref:Membrane protein YgcG n=1 Tax=Caldalkalibacillus horti TaxID=77523 RepID=A0ABT9W2I2_9BACI|nr:TPM domain-containing protein [Bacillus horti]MDQ0167451.1 putative membrane protein YgcG [Bacillus horti]
MGHKKRLSSGVLTIVLLILVFTNPAQAAVVHDSQGYINDHAQMLNEAQRSAIEKVINISSMDLYLYTIPNLDGGVISTLSTFVFDKWELTENDVLMVITAEEREVHIEIAKGSRLDKAFQELSLQEGYIGAGNPYTVFLDQHFIPHAAEGNIKQGVIMVTKELSLLNQSNDEIEVAPVVAEPVQPEQVATGENAPDVSESSLLLSLLVLIALVLVSYKLILMLVEYLKLKKRKKKILSDHQAILVSIHQLEQEIEPLAQFSRGKSETFIKESRDTFYELLQEATKFSRTLAGVSFSFFSSRTKTKKQLEELNDQIVQFRKFIDIVQSAIDLYKGTENEVLPVIEASVKEMEQVDELLRKQLENNPFPLEQIVKRAEDLRGIVQKASQSAQLDPLYAKDILEGVPSRITVLRKEVLLIGLQTEEFRGLPDFLQSKREELEQIINKENLILSEINPFSAFENIQSQHTNLENALRQGDIKASTHMLKNIHQWLKHSFDEVKATIASRDWGKETLNQVDMEKQKFDLYGVTELEEEIQKVQREYHEIHWKKLSETIHTIKANHLEIKQTLPDVRHGLDPMIQFYFRAEKHLTQLILLLEENSSIQLNILHLKYELDAKSQLLKKEFEEHYISFSHLLSRIQLHKLERVQLLQGAEQFIRDVKMDIDQILEAPLLHVEELYTAVKQYSREVENFENQIERTVQEKNQAERSYQHLASAFSEAVKRYRSKIKTSYYNSEFKTLCGRIELALKECEYPKALSFVAEGEGLIDRMKLDYQQKVDLEHAQEMERQRQRNIQRLREEEAALRRANKAAAATSSFWGNSGSSSNRSSGASSGGGSSWNNSSSSGGGSSWSSGSKSTGGSSSWGGSSKSSGGSKGGGSKW